MQITAIREYGDVGTKSIVTTDARSYFGIEQPWRDNLPGHSCIPEGVYELHPYRSPMHGDTYCFYNPDLKIMGAEPLTPEQQAAGYRNVCEIHSANFSEQLRGCLALGLQNHPMYDPITGVVEMAVEESKSALAAFMAELGIGVSGHTMTITKAA